jgi:hypothetical protein
MIGKNNGLGSKMYKKVKKLIAGRGGYILHLYGMPCQYQGLAGKRRQAYNLPLTATLITPLTS